MDTQRRTGRSVRLAVGTLVAGSLAVALGACGGDSGSGGGDDQTITIAYQKFGTFIQADELLKEVKAQFEAENPGATLELVPIEAAENDYRTKLALMNRSPKTAPDLMYEDTFMIKSDVEAGYLQPLDSYLESWDDWDMFVDSAKAAGRGDDGKTYGVPMGTDTRGIWYNKEVFAKAGLPTEWQPETWDDVLAAAQQIKDNVPDVVPFNIPSGKPAGEAASMQGFEMLLYGTGGTLYDEDSASWVVGSQEFIDSLAFIQTVFQTGLGPTPQQALDPNLGTKIGSEWFPQGTIGMTMDGSWVPGTWLEDGSAPWPEWEQVMGAATMPTQRGQAPGAVSMSGGWTLAMGSHTQNPDLAFEALSLALNKDNALAYDVAASQIAVRTDVGEDPAYTSSNPTVPFFTDLVEVTFFRPATSDYAQISNAIQVATESVMTGQQTPEEAAAVYDKTVTGIVGKDAVTEG